MKIRLSPQAIEEYDKAIDYTIEHFGKKVAHHFVTEIKKTFRLLSDNPHLGATELTLADKSPNYRYLLVHPYKMIYYVDVPAEAIYIVTFFNTWQEPDKLLEAVK